MNIALLITTHGRHEITEICFEGVKRLQWIFKRAGFSLKPYIAVSDQPNTELCLTYDFDFIKLPNDQLGKKHNDLLMYARQFEPDYYMQLGSDDLITDSGAFKIIAEMITLNKFFGFSDLLLWHRKSNLCRIHNAKIVFGAGRCMHHSVIDTCLYQLGYVWDDNRQRGLDGNSAANLNTAHKKQYGHCLMPHVIQTRVPCIVDIKSDMNLNPFESIPGRNVPFVSLCAEMV
jgi:hypothetical protein